MEVTKAPRRRVNVPGHDTGRLVPMQKQRTREVYWAAGFLEGEGCFYLRNGYAAICASQKQRDPLERLQRLLGGFINHEKRDDIFAWRLSAQADTALALDLLYPLMSIRRQARIREVIAGRREPVGSGYNNRRKTHCPRGHRYDHLNKKGERRCFRCLRERRRERYRTDPEYRAKILASNREAKKRRRVAT